jgi:hypothetical protein
MVSIRVTVLVVVAVTIVVVTKLVTPPFRTVSVIEIGGFFETCSRHGERSRQYVLMLFASLVRKSCDTRLSLGYGKERGIREDVRYVPEPLHSLL